MISFNWFWIEHCSSNIGKPIWQATSSFQTFEKVWQGNNCVDQNIARYCRELSSSAYEISQQLSSNLISPSLLAKLSCSPQITTKASSHIRCMKSIIMGPQKLVNYDRMTLSSAACCSIIGYYWSQPGIISLPSLNSIWLNIVESHQL